MNHKTVGLIFFATILLIAGAIIVAKRANNDGLDNDYIPAGDFPLVSLSEEKSVGENKVSLNLAPDFTLEQLNGSNLTLSDYRGQKPVVLDFWASWCPNCRRDMPVLNKLYDKYDKEVEVIGVNLQESKNVATKYIESAGIIFPIVLDPRGNVSTAYGIQYTNVHVLISREGEIVKVIPGDIKESDFISLLQN